MEPLYIFDENFIFWPALKSRVKKIMGRSPKGPQAVALSLKRGLSELGVEFFWNKPIANPIMVACVLSGVKTLRWAIGRKKQGFIKKIIAGPNLIVLPSDAGGVILSPEIDFFVVPSQWSKDWLCHLEPEFGKKVLVWPAGVQDRGSLVNGQGFALVFQKNAPPEILRAVKAGLELKNIAYQVLAYGGFNRREYSSLLQKSRFMVYLSPSESQGLALHEAWMAGVPSLVWNPGFIKYQNLIWKDAKISAPYLVDACGYFFQGSEDFSSALEKFLSAYPSFTPRKYSLENFTNKIAAEKYLLIAHSLS